MHSDAIFHTPEEWEQIQGLATLSNDEIDELTWTPEVDALMHSIHKHPKRRSDYWKIGV